MAVWGHPQMLILGYRAEHPCALMLEPTKESLGPLPPRNFFLLCVACVCQLTAE